MRDTSGQPLAREAMAYVLAGGRGSRLNELTDNRAKPAVYFGGKARIIDFALSNAINSGIRRIGVLTQYKAQSLIRHIERGWGFLEVNLGEYIDVVPAQQRVDEHWYSGTANAVYQNLDLLGEAVVWFALVPASGGPTGVPLPAIDTLDEGVATLVNGWQLRYAPALDRRCGDEEEFSSYRELRDELGDDFTSVFDTTEQRLVAVVCRERVAYAPTTTLPTTTTTEPGV